MYVSLENSFKNMQTNYMDIVSPRKKHEFITSASNLSTSFTYIGGILLLLLRR
jgi:hypothetical protein